MELQTGIAANDASMVTAELQNANISYHYEPSSGTVMVRSEQLSLARGILAEKGLLEAYRQPATRKYPDPLRDTMQPGSSHGLPPQQVLEAELAKSIASIDNVQSARVHLAFDNISGNISSHAPRASVMVRLYHGKRLSEAQISSISHLVAASTANLSLDNITIIDQTGQLLKSSGASSKIASLSSAQFSYLRRLEQSYINRIMDILTPVLGLNTLRTQVVAEVDFKTLTPEVMENPPPDNVAAENGGVRRLAVTVLVDNRLVDDGGKVVQTARSAEEMQRITELVKHAIGFSSQRGDTVTVVNEPFNLFSNPADAGRASLWQGLWYKNSLWYLAFGLVLAIAAGVIIRSMRSGINVSRISPAPSAVFSPSASPVRDEQKAQHESSEPGAEGAGRKTSFEHQLQKIRQVVREDPKIAAQIVKSWVKESD
jgi:flagellar biosynthesis/type III secretory pathway M-ring protein FliF/YscJ